MIEGVDYSTAHPSIQSLVDGGKEFAGRYVGLGGFNKWLTQDEAKVLSVAGVSIVALCEGVTSWMLGGWSAGQAATKAANAQAVGCGMPPDRPIYLSCDFDVTAAQWPAVLSCLAGAANVVGVERVGIYGGTNALRWARTAGAASWFWQALGWRQGVWLDWVNVQQYRNGVSFGGGNVDFDQALTVDYGQWKVRQAMTATNNDKDLYGRMEALVYLKDKFGDWLPDDPGGNVPIVALLKNLPGGPQMVADVSTAILNGLDYDRLASAIAAKMTQRPLSVSVSGELTGTATPQGA